MKCFWRVSPSKIVPICADETPEMSISHHCMPTGLNVGEGAKGKRRPEFKLIFIYFSRREGVVGHGGGKAGCLGAEPLFMRDIWRRHSQEA